MGTCPFTWTVAAKAPPDLVQSDSPGNALAKNTEGQKYDSFRKTKEMEAIVCTCIGWYVECLSTCLILSTDLHSRPGGIPGLHQSEAQRKIAEASRATGPA